MIINFKIIMFTVIMVMYISPEAGKNMSIIVCIELAIYIFLSICYYLGKTKLVH